MKKTFATVLGLTFFVSLLCFSFMQISMSYSIQTNETTIAQKMTHGINHSAPCKACDISKSTIHGEVRLAETQNENLITELTNTLTLPSNQEIATIYESPPAPPVIKHLAEHFIELSKTIVLIV